MRQLPPTDQEPAAGAAQMTLGDIAAAAAWFCLGAELGRVLEARLQRKRFDELMHRDETLLQAQRELTDHVSEIVDELRSGRSSRVH